MANSTTTQKLCNWFMQQSNARGHVLTPVKLNHLVILADWWHLHRTGAFLINERVEAWPSGPVLPSIYHEYKDQPPYSSIEHPSRRQPPLEEETDIIPFLEHIWNVYGKYTAQQVPVKEAVDVCGAHKLHPPAEDVHGASVLKAGEEDRKEDK